MHAEPIPMIPTTSQAITDIVNGAVDKLYAYKSLRPYALSNPFDRFFLVASIRADTIILCPVADIVVREDGDEAARWLNATVEQRLVRRMEYSSTQKKEVEYSYEELARSPMIVAVCRQVYDMFNAEEGEPS
jgi:hypothetical protein